MPPTWARYAVCWMEYPWLSATTRIGEKDKRHRSLNAVVEWSFALLTPDLRRFFLALSVFRGGWHTEAARAVTGDAYALDSLSRLRGHSLSP
jgi:hypothetical protein